MERWALITGASMGLGADFARILAERNFNLILVARSVEKLEALASELRSRHSIKAEVIGSDLAKPDSAGKLHDEISRRNLSVEVLVNNAGFGYLGATIDEPLETFVEMVELNVVTPLKLTRMFAEDMAKRGLGHILNVASTAAFQPVPNFSVYSATKAFVLSFSESLSAELQGRGVHVATLCPGPTRTSFHSRAKTEQARLMRFMMDSRHVALTGVNGMFSGKTVIVPGFMNRLLTFTVRLTPRSLVTKISGLLISRATAH